MMMTTSTATSSFLPRQPVDTSSDNEAFADGATHSPHHQAALVDTSTLFESRIAPARTTATTTTTASAKSLARANDRLQSSPKTGLKKGMPAPVTRSSSSGTRPSCTSTVESATNTEKGRHIDKPTGIVMPPRPTHSTSASPLLPMRHPAMSTIAATATQPGIDTSTSQHTRSTFTTKEHEEPLSHATAAAVPVQLQHTHHLVGTTNTAANTYTNTVTTTTAALASSTTLSSPKQQNHSKFKLSFNPRDTATAATMTMAETSPRSAPSNHSSSNHAVNRIPRYQENSAKSATKKTQPSEGRKGKLDPLQMEQALFEQRLCDDPNGVAVRKINQYGKANIRYVRCVTVPDDDPKTTSNRSLSSKSAGSRGKKHIHVTEKSKRGLSWGKKKEVVIPLDRFVSVRKGKTTERTRRNIAPSSRVLSLITDVSQHPSLDIETPTKIDRDKFARAFARFLDVPLEATDEISSVQSADNNMQQQRKATHPNSEESRWSASISAPGDVGQDDANAGATAHPIPFLSNMEVSTEPSSDHQRDAAHEIVKESIMPTSLPMPTSAGQIISESKVFGDSLHSSQPSSTNHDCSNNEAESTNGAFVVTKIPPVSDQREQVDDDATEVSSITGHAYDQELVEELHQALNDLRSQLEESRAEAARAVKVAEQAIQSAEKNTSVEWQDTVTHKAAEAAAIAQRRSAEAMAKQRLAEERLEGERKTAAFWRKQAEVAEEEAGHLQTRAAAAEVQRAAIEELLKSERHLFVNHLEALSNHYQATEAQHNKNYEEVLDRNRALELELEATRRDLQARASFQDNSENISGSLSGSPRNSTMRNKITGFGRKKRPTATDGTDSKQQLLGTHVTSSSSTALSSSPIMAVMDLSSSSATDGLHLSEHAPAQGEHILKLQADALQMRRHFDLLQKETEHGLLKLPVETEQWVARITKTVRASQMEIGRLRDRLAVECASRRKLLHEVQDLRGTVRVYCRPLNTGEPSSSASSSSSRFISIPSHEILMLHRDATLSRSVTGYASSAASSASSTGGPMSFEFDRVFSPEATQQDVYAELEDVCLGVLDGYNVSVMAYGQTGSGKTYTMFGGMDVVVEDQASPSQTFGVHFRALQQLFAVSEQRNERYKDTFFLSILEVYNERLCDMLAGTPSGEHRGNIVTAESAKNNNGKKGKLSKPSEDDSSSGRQIKLEIRTDLHGDTVVQGQISVQVDSFDELRRIWHECLGIREQRLAEQDLDIGQYDAACHIFARIKVVSTNIVTGMGSVGKMDFVDMAGADLMPRRGKNLVGAAASGSKPTAAVTADGVVTSNEWRFTNRSLDALHDVVDARAQFLHTVPYRNSTLTHLVRDSLEHDTKLILLSTISMDPAHYAETVSTLRFAARMRQISIGKATKHVLTAP